MSMYGDSNRGKNNLYDEILEFLREYSIVDLLEVVMHAIRDYE